MFSRIHIIWLSVLLGTTVSLAQWQLQPVLGWTSPQDKSDIAYKSNGYPVIAFPSYRNSRYYLDVEVWDGDSWNTTTIGSSSNYSYSRPRVLITSDDVILVAYYYSYNNTTYLYRLGLGNLTTFSGFLQDVVMMPTTEAYEIHFLYGSGTLYYRKYPTPNTEILVDTYASGGTLAVDTQGHVNVIYTSTSGPSRLKYAYYNGTSWSSWLVEPLTSASNYKLLLDNEVPVLYAQTGSSPNYSVKQIVIQR